MATLKSQSFTEAIRNATAFAMGSDGRIHVFGLGVTYGADGTTAGLAKEYPGRVHDVPCSEAAITGMAVGAALQGLRPIVHHGRVEFALLGMDQILTQAANWNYMFGGYPCPVVFRIAVGRQWGNGSQHTRVARGMFAVPGLKVVVPSTPQMAASLLLSAVQDANPIVYLEPRWLYKTTGAMDLTALSLGNARVVRAGRDVTIVAVGEMVLEVLHAAARLEAMSIAVEVIDPVSIFPIDYTGIAESVKRTGRLLVMDAGLAPYGIGADIVASLSEMDGATDFAYGRLQPPTVPCPTAPELTALFYPDRNDAVRAVCQLMGCSAPPDEPRSFEEIHLPPAVSIDKVANDLTAR